jgi:hypothetical protein
MNGFLAVFHYDSAVRVSPKRVMTISFVEHLKPFGAIAEKGTCCLFRVYAAGWVLGVCEYSAQHQSQAK